MHTCRGLLWTLLVLLPILSRAQQAVGFQLDKMPADLETALALSALPPHLRSGATVYLLDPNKGYYAVRRGTNGFADQGHGDQPLSSGYL